MTNKQDKSKECCDKCSLKSNILIEFCKCPCHSTTTPNEEKYKDYKMCYCDDPAKTHYSSPQDTPKDWEERFDKEFPTMYSGDVRSIKDFIFTI